MEKQDIDKTKCPKCGSALKPIEDLPSGKRLQRCSTGSWNAETKKTEGCDYVKWLNAEPQELDEKCPKCGASLILTTTRFGKKMKKCSKGGWDKDAKKATGCDYIEWINSSTKEELDEACPLCGAKLVMMTTANGKKMKKCSTSGWDREKKQATGCTHVEWINTRKSNGDENFPEYEV